MKTLWQEAREELGQTGAGLVAAGQERLFTPKSDLANLWGMS